jgi:hypothetical protein
MQGTYGNVYLNGKAEFQGCAVGCLSTPHTQNRMYAFLKEHLSYGGNSGGLDHEGLGQRESLTEDFGLNPTLIAVVEALFECQPTHGAAIEFVPQFANALHEGAEINDDAVLEWLDHRELPVVSEWNPIHDEIEYADPEFIENATSEFLEFVASFVPVTQQKEVALV